LAPGPQDGQTVRSASGTEGAVFVEFLVAFLPVLTMFLCLVQLALLFAVRLAVEHAAVVSARAAAVVIGDDPKAYQGQVEAMNEVRPNTGARYNTIRRAALLTLAPFIADGTIRSVDVLFPSPNEPGGPTQSDPRWNPMARGNIDKVRVRIRVEAICKIALASRIACGGWRLGPFDWRNPFRLLRPGKTVQAEAIFPYQGARYTYQ
jgi:hypothetical protein